MLETTTSLDLMRVAGEQGWSGFALKTCKGHSFALVAAAWDRHHGMHASLQDLTNPGLSMIHAAWFALHGRAHMNFRDPTPVRDRRRAPYRITGRAGSPPPSSRKSAAIPGR